MKTESSINEDLAVKCCIAMKKAMEKGDFADWETIGELRWHQIRGLMHGNNIAISMREEGRKKKYTLYVVSTQGTQVTSEFDGFTYKHTNNTLYIQFSLSDKVCVEHKVSYGE